MKHEQLALFQPQSMPAGFRYAPDLIDAGEEARLVADRRSVYLMRGPSRDEWEHSIPAVDALRYSITFRSMRDKA
jgi:alkylated DNA repair dioxygenase AlkB